jgi:hypothetical protein
MESPCRRLKHQSAQREMNVLYVLAVVKSVNICFFVFVSGQGQAADHGHRLQAVPVAVAVAATLVVPILAVQAVPDHRLLAVNQAESETTVAETGQRFLVFLFFVLPGFTHFSACIPECIKSKNFISYAKIFL